MSSTSDTKVIGGVLLIIGTSIGAGMLALPVGNAQAGFWSSSLLLIACWALMTFATFLILEVNLALPERSNLISMANATLGPVGKVLMWVSYLLLLYSLLCAYIAGGSDVFQNILSLAHLKLPQYVAAIIFTLLLGLVVISGIRLVDFVNRGLMSIKVIVFLLLVLIISPFVDLGKLHEGDSQKVFHGLMLVVTSFGFAIIVPSLRNYFSSDIAKLRKTIFIGTLIPLVCYIVWQAVIMGVVPLHGVHGLISIAYSGHETTQLTESLELQLRNEWITEISRFFTSICMLTSFLGVSLALSDFLADGTQLTKQGIKGGLLFAITFLPPLGIFLLYPEGFITALSYAGFLCVIILMFMPALMSWFARYRNNMQLPYQAMGGKGAILLLLSVSIVFFILGIYQEF